MALSTGTGFGSYEILSARSAGVMAEVYRTADRNLKQVVGQILPPSRAVDADRLARDQCNVKALPRKAAHVAESAR